MRWEELSAIVKLLRQCASAKDRFQGLQLHSMLARSGRDSRTIIGNFLVKMYGDCGLVADAYAAFHNTVHRNVFSWNILMAAAADGGETGLARYVFDQMPGTDIVSWNAMIGIYARAREIDELRSIFAAMPERDSCSWNTVIAGPWHLEEAVALFSRIPQTSVITWNTILSSYGDSRMVLEANKIFDLMPERDASSWNAIVVANAVAGNPERAVELIELMPQHTLSSFNVLLTSHCSQGRLEQAKVLLLDHCFCSWNTISWTAVIAGYAQAGRSCESLQLFRFMDLDGIQPDNITFISVACAIASIPSLSQGKMLREVIQDHGLPPDVPLGTNLINMFAKCGDLAAARRVFQEMPLRDIVAWNAMLTAYAQAGDVDRTLDFFYAMVAEGIHPVPVSFVNLLSCCSHAGLTRQCVEYFRGMSGDFGLVAGFEHYRCLIDMLGRAGHLAEAQGLIEGMPFEADGVIWNTLLGACRNYGDLERAERVGEVIFRSDPELLSSYALLSSTYVEYK